MKTDEHYIHSTYCWSLGIKIFAKYVSSTKVKICVENNGKIKVGDALYEQNSKKQTETWSAKIREMYMQYYKFYKSKEKKENEKAEAV